MGNTPAPASSGSSSSRIGGAGHRPSSYHPSNLPGSSSFAPGASGTSAAQHPRVGAVAMTPGTPPTTPPPLAAAAVGTDETVADLCASSSTEGYELIAELPRGSRVLRTFTFAIAPHAATRLPASSRPAPLIDPSTGVASYPGLDASDARNRRSVSPNIVIKAVPGAIGKDLKIIRSIRSTLESHQRRLWPRLHPNVIPYAKVHDDTNPPYLVRQHFAFSLHKRLSTRPFLSDIEKRWIAYQIVSGVAQLHGARIVHGDLKSENVMITTWGWVVLVDPAPFKPAYLGGDHAAIFNQFFSATGTKRCYLAPERLRGLRLHEESLSGASSSVFAPNADGRASAQSLLRASGVSYSETLPNHTMADKLDAELAQQAFVQARAGENVESADRAELAQTFVEGPGGKGVSANVTMPSMDIFSLGCVLAELFNDGEPTFGLSDMLVFSSSGTLPDGSKIEKLSKHSPSVYRLVKAMTHVDPAHRLRASDYLKLYTGDSADDVFPTSFGYLFKFMASMREPSLSSAESRVWYICQEYALIVRELGGRSDPAGEAYFAQYVKAVAQDSAPKTEPASKSVSFAETVTVSFADTNSEERSKSQRLRVESLLEESERLLQILESDGLEKPREQAESESEDVGSNEEQGEDENATEPSRKRGFFQLPQHRSSVHDKENALVPIVALLCASIQHLVQPQSKIVTMFLMQRLCNLCGPPPVRDEMIFQRAIPFVLDRMSDEAVVVRCTAMRVLVALLESATCLPPSDLRFFSEYLFPEMFEKSKDAGEAVRAALGETFPRVALAAKRLLETTRSLAFVSKRAEAEAPTSETNSRSGSASETYSFDREIKPLHEAALKMINNMSPADTRDGDLGSQRAMVRNALRMCLFFGRRHVNEYFLPWLVSRCDNRGNWRLRIELLNSFAAVGLFIGPPEVEIFLLPLIVDLMHQDRENAMIVESALRCLTSLARLESLNRDFMIDIAFTATRAFHSSSSTRVVNALIVLLVSVMCSPKVGVVEVQVTILPEIRQILGLKDDEPAEDFSALLGHVDKVDFASHVEILSDLFAARRRPEPHTKARTPSPFIADVTNVSMSGESVSSFASSSLLHAASTSSLRTNPSTADVDALRRPDSRHSNQHSSQQQVFAPIYTIETNTWTKAPPADVLTSQTTNAQIAALSTKYGLVQGDSSESYTGGYERLKQRVDALELVEIVHDLGACLDGIPAPPAYWQPSGQMIASIYKHQGPVRRLSLIGNGAVFCSASDDGTVQAWSTHDVRVCPHPFFSVTGSGAHAVQGGRATDVCGIPHSWSLAAGFDSGVKVVRLDTSNARHVEIACYPSSSSIACVAAAGTSLSSIEESGLYVARDLRSEREEFSFTLSAAAGTPTSVCDSPDGSWRAIGTMRGCVLVLDSRTRLLIRGWRHPAGNPIHRVLIVDDPRTSTESANIVWLAVGGENQAAALNVETGERKFVFSAQSGPRASETSEAAQLAVEPFVPFSTSVGDAHDAWDHARSTPHRDRGVQYDDVRAVIVPFHKITDVTTSRVISPIRASAPPWVLTAGTDRVVRLWDVATREKSKIVCGSLLDAGGAGYDGARWRYKDIEKTDSTKAGSLFTFRPSSDSSSPPNTGSVVNRSREPLLSAWASRAHDDAILDAVWAKVTVSTMDGIDALVTAGRDGVIKIWQ